MSVFLQPRHRTRSHYLLAVFVTIMVGLLSRRFPEILPSLLGKYPGDVLWSLMVFFGWGFVFRRASSLRIVLLTLATSYTIEVLKLWQSPWWFMIRHTTIGHLVFGHVFSWSNLVAYTVGAMLGLLFEFVAFERRNTRSPMSVK